MRQNLDHYVADPGTYAHLVTYARRRGAHQDPEDIVQEAICDALAVEAVPTVQDEIPKWVNTIVRRRVADWYRHTRRWSQDELGEIACQNDVESRDLLGAVEQNVDPGQRETLGCLLREHAGESLADIAHEQGLDAASLRQRICRLRRHLRSRLAGAAAMLLVVFGGATWYAHHHPSLSDSLVAVGTSRYDGSYCVVDVAHSEFKKLGLTVQVRGGWATASDPTGVVRARLQIEQKSSHSLIVRSPSQRWDVEVIDLGSGRLRLNSARGFVVLERLAHPESPTAIAP